MLQSDREQVCVEDVHFKTLSWSDRIFVVVWNILCKLCGSAKKYRVKDIFSLVGYHDSCLAAINIRSHSVLFYEKQEILAKGFLLPTLLTSILFTCF